jgi:hypothetical protein
MGFTLVTLVVLSFPGQTINQIKANAEQRCSEPDSRFTLRDTLVRPLHPHP